MTMALFVVWASGCGSTQNEPIGSFHRQDKIRTPLSEWIFMAVAFVAVLIGFPVLIATLFAFVVPLLGRLWTP